MNIEIADRLLNYRKSHGFSQEELAEKIGVSRQAVSKWERAEASPDTDNLISLAKIYGVTLDELFKVKKETKAENSENSTHNYENDKVRKIDCESDSMQKKTGNNILKSFFCKPITVVTSAVIFLTAVIKLSLSLTGFSRIDFLSIIFEEKNNFIRIIEKYNINLFEIFVAVALLIFFIKSRSKNGNLNFASAFFRTGSIISLILVIILLLLSLALACFMVFALFFGTAIFLIRYLPVAVISVGAVAILFTVLLVICALILLLAVSQLLFAGSVRKSVRDEKIRRKTAMFFSVMNFIFAVLSLLSAIFVAFLDSGSVQLAITVNLLLNAFPYLFLGITSLSYFTYTKNETYVL